MPSGSFRAALEVDVRKLSQIARAAGMKVVDAAARELAFEVLRRAMVYLENQVYTRPNVVVSGDKIGTVPEPTGALWNSGYVRSFTGEVPQGCQTESQAMSAARSRNQEVVFGQAPPGPARLGQAQVLFAVEYGLYVEMGTIFMAARPFLAPAANEVQGFAERFVRAKLIEAGFSA